MSAVVKAVASVVENTVKTVGDVVENTVEAVKDVGRAIDDYVIQPIKEDPVSFAIQVAATYVGIPPPVTAAAITASKGGDIEDIGKSALAAYVAPKVGDVVGRAVSQQVAGSALQNTLASAAGSAAAGATSAAITGGDIGKSAILGGATGAASDVARQVTTGMRLDTEPYSEQTRQLAAQEAGLVPETRAAERIASGVTGAALTGGDIEKTLQNMIIQEATNKLISEGKTALQASKEAESAAAQDEIERLAKEVEDGLRITAEEQPGLLKPVDYSLTAGSKLKPTIEGMGAQGLSANLAELPPSESIGYEPINYEDLFRVDREGRGKEDMGGAQGIRVPKTSEAEGMGGAQGLTVPVEGGTVSEGGFTPEGELLRQIQEELYPTPSFEGEALTEGKGTTEGEITGEPIVTGGVVGEGAPSRTSIRAGEPVGISSRVTGEAAAGILGEKEPLFGGDENDQRAVWNRRSLRLRRALGL